MVRLENSYRELPAALWAEAMPTPVRHPQLVLFNETLAAELGLAQLDEGEAAQVLRVMCYRWVVGRLRRRMRGISLGIPLC